MKTTTRILSFLFLGLAAACALAQTDPNAVVASVNGDEIKSAEYWHRLVWYRVDVRSPLAGLPVGFLTLKDLITERLVFELAKEKGVTPSEPEIDAEEKDQGAKNPTLLQDVKDSGRTEADLRHDIAYTLAQYNLRTFGVTITDQQIEEHYKAYPSLYTIPKRYKVRVIVVGDDTATAEVDKDLAAGKSFADVAASRSLDVSKSNGGEFGELSTDNLGTPVAQALEGVKIGQTTVWVKGGQQDSVRVKYLVEDIVPPKLRPLDADLRKQIRKRLSIDKGDVRNTVAADLDAATMKAKIVITNPVFQRLYDQMLKQYSASHKPPSGNPLP